MTPRHVLREAYEVVKRDRTATQLAVDAHGVKVKNPRSPRAAAWSSVGALIKVAPRYPKIVSDDGVPGHIDAAWTAFEFLTIAAEQQGYTNTVEVDRAGPEAVYAMFLRALDLAPADEPSGPDRRRPSSSTGALPRGVEAA